MRPLGIAAVWLALVALVGTVVLGGGARAGLLGLQDATPAATPVAPAETDVVTLIAAYLPAGDRLVLRPIETEDEGLADLEAEGDEIGEVDFTAVNETLPRITIGDSTFDAYPRYEGDVEGGLRWIWFYDAPQLRPATLVVQVAGTAGQYQGYDGTATFVSRGENAGGVLVLLLVPPAPQTPAAGAETPAAAAETPAAAGAETPAVVVEGPVSEATALPGGEDETPAATTRRP